MQRENIYQSILAHLGNVPVNHLQEVDVFLRNLTTEIQQKEQNRLSILNLAGSWADMSEQDFNDYLQVIKDTKSDMFTRDIDL